MRLARVRKIRGLEPSLVERFFYVEVKLALSFKKIS